MAILVDIALALILLAAALFLGSTALALFKEVNKKDKDE